MHSVRTSIGSLLAAASIFVSGCATDPIKDPAPWVNDHQQKHQWLPNAEHKTCVAFSGGGIRAATFSIGVMQGLNDADLLKEVDVISATSGGSYATSWLYTAVGPRKLTLDQALDPHADEQRRLAENAPNFVGGGWGAWSFATGMVLEPFSRGYKKLACATAVIDQALTPGGAMAGYQASLWLTFYGKQKPKFSDLVELDGMPEFVVGASVLSGESPSCASNDKRPPLYPAEISKDGLKVGEVVYREPPIEWGINEVISAAGGATDVVATDSNGLNLCKLPTMIRPLLGSMACTPKVPESQKTFITDGGFTDNLAVLPLIHRQCDVIISVDATHDPNLEFEDLKKQLTEPLKKLGVDVNQITAGISADIAGSSFIADRAASVVAMKNTQSGGRFVYVKLGIPVEEMGNLPSLVSDTYSYSRNNYPGDTGCKMNRHGTKLRCRYPQESTLRQTFFPSEYMAYRDLGHWITAKKLVPLLAAEGLITEKSRVSITPE